MIITYPSYLDQTQIIGLQGILEYHGIAESLEISGVYGITYDKPSTQSQTFDRPSTHSKTYDKPSTHSRTYDN